MTPNTVEGVYEKYGSIMTPGSLSFVIWGPICVALAVFCLYHLFVAFNARVDHLSNRDLSQIGILFTVNNLAGSGWIILWSNEQLLPGIALALLQLYCLIRINLRLKIHDENRNFFSKALTQFPLSVYFAWISFAAISSISAYVVSLGWKGFGISDTQWNIMMIVFLIMLSTFVIVRRRNVSYGFVMIWFMYGIILKGQELNTQAFSPVMQMAWMGTGIVSLICLFQLIRNMAYENELHAAAEEAWIEEERVVNTYNSQSLPPTEVQP